MSHRRGSDARPGLIVELALTQLIDRGPAFHSQSPFQHPLGTHFAREVHRGHPARGSSERHSQSERGLAAANVASEHNEILATETSS
jgi:hypothetical protein